jgi:23S rRNA (adenine2030-N6)-methyltransferase
MLSYQHAYHAGCPADVHKHGVLAKLLQCLTAKGEPITLIDTHAGRGLYSLTSVESKKTGEAIQGIVRLLNEKKLDPSHPLFKVIAEVRRVHGPAAYPGSPLIAHSLLGAQDRLHLMELHPQEHKALKRLLGKKANVSIQRQDGFGAALDMVPPTPRSGLVVIDPSYEMKSEYEQTADFVMDMHEDWPEAIIMLWYPLLKAGHHKAMVEMLTQAKLTGFHVSEMIFAKPEDVRGMHGSGLVMVNLPQAFEPVLDAFKWPYPV